MTAPATTPEQLGAPVGTPSRLGVWATAIAEAAIPLGLALLVTGLILAALDRDAIGYYRDIVQASVGRPSGMADTILRTAPILFIGSALIVVFRAGLWNLGMDGQYLLAAAFVAGLGPWIMSVLPVAAGWLVITAIAITVGAAWTLVPSLLKAVHGINEIVTTLMMSFIGISIAQILVIGPFDGAAAVPQTESIPREAMLPLLPGTRVHVGVVLAVVVCVVVQVVFSRTSLGTRLDVMGANLRAAGHLGIDVRRLTVIAFLISGGLIGLAASVDIQGEFGYMRADWNPAYGLSVVPLVFLARMNAVALIPFGFFFSMLTVGGLYASRQARLPSEFVLLFMGILLLSMVGMRHLSELRASGGSVLPRRRAARP